MRNNNIIIVKCFISSFAGEHIHQRSRGGGREGGRERRGMQGTWYERGAAWRVRWLLLPLSADDWR